jgi:hypothetical protein
MIRKKDKRLNRELDRIGSLRSRASGLVTRIAALDADRANPSVIDNLRQQLTATRQQKQTSEESIMNLQNSIHMLKAGEKPSKKLTVRKVREHVQMGQARMRSDPRPIDATCACYTCKNFSRGYLHHLFKAQEALGGTLVRNVFTGFLLKAACSLQGLTAGFVVLL